MNEGVRTALHVRYREFRFPVEVGWDGGRHTTAHVNGKQTSANRDPARVPRHRPELWSPEDAFVAAAASCLAVTIAALVERNQLPLPDLSVHADRGRRGKA